MDSHSRTAFRSTPQKPSIFRATISPRTAPPAGASASTLPRPERTRLGPRVGTRAASVQTGGSASRPSVIRPQVPQLDLERIPARHPKGEDHGPAGAGAAEEELPDEGLGSGRRSVWAEEPLRHIGGSPPEEPRVHMASIAFDLRRRQTVAGRLTRPDHVELELLGLLVRPWGRRAGPENHGSAEGRRDGHLHATTIVEPDPNGGVPTRCSIQ